MLAWGPYAHPTSSFNKPVPIPGAEPDMGPCVTVSFGQAWLPYVLGALTQLLLQTTWDTDDREVFLLVQEQASTLISSIAEQGYSEMSGCGCGCGGAGSLTRWNDEGALEISYDGGATWQPFPQGDPRINGNYYPKLPLATGNVTRCAAAENIVANMTAQVDQYADDLESLANLAALIVDIDATVAVFLGIAGATLAFIAILAAELIPLGASAVRSAFDTPVWDRLRCNIYCRADENGLLTQGDVNAIKEKIGTDETGITVILLRQMIDTLGPRGLTNAGRLGGGDGDTCDDCDCNDFCVSFDDPAQYDLLAYSAYYGFGTIGITTLDSGDGNPSPCANGGTGLDGSSIPGYSCIVKIPLIERATVLGVSADYKYRREDVAVTALRVDYWNDGDTSPIATATDPGTGAEETWNTAGFSGSGVDCDYIVVINGGSGVSIGSGYYGKLDNICINT